MKVAMIGLGKLGLPVSCAMCVRGHEVYGFDVDKAKMRRYRSGVSELYEPDMDSILQHHLDDGLHLVDSVKEAVGPAQIVFVAVPTPSREDDAFDTSIVIDALQAVATEMKACSDYKVVAIISTVLPMTTRNEFLPELVSELGVPGERYGVAYNAQFIAMGTVMHNYLRPEFVLVGEYDERSGDVLQKFYRQLTDSPVLRMSLENAELVKMIYNTFIGMKIIYANTIMELCDKIPGADCDVVSYAIGQATDRLISDWYLMGGMGDGGGCHPRDNRALSWLAEALDLRTDPFSYVMAARTLQTGYIAEIANEEHRRTGLPVAILGLTFKPKTNLTDDSPSLLLADILRKRHKISAWLYDPIVKPGPMPSGPYVYILATRHKELEQFPFVPGSVIVDVWRMLDEPPEGCVLRSIGAR
jgi:UDPglucose 6-dehydrogenase